MRRAQSGGDAASGRLSCGDRAAGGDGAPPPAPPEPRAPGASAASATSRAGRRGRRRHPPYGRGERTAPGAGDRQEQPGGVRHVEQRPRPRRQQLHRGGREQGVRRPGRGRQGAAAPAGSAPSPGTRRWRAVPAGTRRCARSARPGWPADRPRRAAGRPAPCPRRSRPHPRGPADAARTAGGPAGSTRPPRCGPRSAGAGRRRGRARRPGCARGPARARPGPVPPPCSASSVVPKVVKARNALVRCNRPHGSPRYPECAATAVMATGCSDWSSSAARPPTYIDASRCTVRTGRSGANQRGPGVACTRARVCSADGPATRCSRTSPARSRALPTTGGGQTMTPVCSARPSAGGPRSGRVVRTAHGLRRGRTGAGGTGGGGVRRRVRGSEPGDARGEEAGEGDAADEDQRHQQPGVLPHPRSGGSVWADEVEPSTGGVSCGGTNGTDMTPPLPRLSRCRWLHDGPGAAGTRSPQRSCVEPVRCRPERTRVMKRPIRSFLFASVLGVEPEHLVKAIRHESY